MLAPQGEWGKVKVKEGDADKATRAPFRLVSPGRILPPSQKMEAGPV